jgi:type 1 glutamine amidotransferase
MSSYPRFREPQWPPRVLVVTRPTDPEYETHGHPWAATTPLLCQCLLNAGFEVELDNNLARVRNRRSPEEDRRDGRLASFDAVLLHGKLEQRDDEAVAALRDFVHDGKGLVVVHIASASFAPDAQSISPEWLALVGSVWVYGPPPAGSSHPEPAKAITVRVTAPSHPIMASLPSEFTLQREELYQNMGQGPDGPGQPLAVGYDARQAAPQPVAFALERGKGRVFNLYLGHFVSTHSDWRFQKLLTQGLEWAARC